ncbi:MAG: hypothetical protein IJX77_09055 [Ruminococcus sp.]|nr:hypothetical protein [Ruminococcus sp.]
MENKKRFSLLKTVIAVIAILFIIVSLVINIAFSGGKTPNVFGKYIYLVDENSVGEGVTPGAALMAAETDGSDVIVGDIVLCYTEDGGDKLQLRGICDVVQGEDGIKKYAIGIGTTPLLDEAGDRITVTSDKIAAICTGNPQSLELGKYISFTSNIKGILLQLILPCVILVIFLIVKIASSSSDEEEEQNYDFYDYDEEAAAAEAGQYPSHERQNSPLFEPSQEIQPSNEFERKKMSIAENFSQKQVDHNSSYQKEKERTMQFKAQRAAAPESPSANYRARHQRSAESSFAARNVGGQYSTAPTADALREEMLRKTAEAERTGTFSTNGYGGGRYSNNSASDVTGVFSKAQLAEIAGTEIPGAAQRRAPASHAASTRKSSSPDIDDIITKSEANAKKRSASNMSVDDLLKMIENEKNKL